LEEKEFALRSLQQSSIINHQSNPWSAAPRRLDSFASSFPFQGCGSHQARRQHKQPASQSALETRWKPLEKMFLFFSTFFPGGKLFFFVRRNTMKHPIILKRKMGLVREA